MEGASYLESLPQEERAKILAMASAQAGGPEQSIVEQLRSHLKKEVTYRKQLQTHLEQLKAQLQLENKQNEEEQAQLVSQNNQLQTENEQMNKQLKNMQKQVQFYKRQHAQTQEQQECQQEGVSNLRGLVKNLLNGQANVKKKEAWEKNFWENFEADEFIFESEPPSNFSIYKNEVPISRELWERQQLEMRNITQEVKELTKRYNAQSKENEELKAQLLTVKKETGTDSEKLKKQLYGCIRRIQYLLQERDKLQKEAIERNQYITKLEYRIVKDNMNIKGLKQKVKNISQNVVISPKDESESKSPRMQSQQEDLEQLDLLIAQQQLENLMDNQEGMPPLDRESLEMLVDEY